MHIHNNSMRIFVALECRLPPPGVRAAPESARSPDPVSRFDRRPC